VALVSLLQHINLPTITVVRIFEMTSYSLQLQDQIA
jgi:hypothetical protein